MVNRIRSVDRWPAVPTLNLFLIFLLFALSNANVRAGPADQLEAAKSLQARGETAEAEAIYRDLLDQYRQGRLNTAVDLATAAAAAAQLGTDDPQHFKDAVSLYDEAIAVDASYWPAHIALGNLLLEKYNNTEAQAVFQEVLQQVPDDPDALLGMARSQHFDFSPKAYATVQRALAIEPTHVVARVFLARLYIELEQYQDAEREALRALRQAPNSLAALSVLAAVHYLSGAEEAFARTEAQTLALNPVYAELYNELAELAARNRLYSKAVEFAEKAVALNAKTWRGHALLGMNQLRIGVIEAGRASLQTAFAGDPYNVWVKNTLDLADTFIDYELIDSAHFQLFVHRDEQPVLVPLVLEVAEQAYTQFSEKYAIDLDQPIRIEMYPRHADFSVRTVGLAGMGILGVSFGPVVAMDSPNGRPVGSFNWASTLWHELAHTFHLAVSRHRVPRWFSEGLAVFEEHQQRVPGWGMDVSPDFLLAHQAGKLLPVSELNNGFVRPTYPKQIIHSYYQASLVFDLINQRWGFKAILAMLRGFGEGHSLAELFESILGMDGPSFDQAFNTYFEERFAAPLAVFVDRAAERKTPLADDQGSTQVDTLFTTWMEEADQAYAEKRYAEAERLWQLARDRFPEYADEHSAYARLASLYQEQNKYRLAIEQLTSMIEIDSENFAAHLAAATLLEQLGESSRAVDLLARAQYIFPFSLAMQRQLARLASASNDWPVAIRSREAVLALQPVDQVAARYELAKALLGGGQLKKAKFQLLRALEVAPDFDKALDLLLEIRAGGG